ncbi:MAG TPA: M23 family metallopeptidase [Pseudonocardia sp.]
MATGATVAAVHSMSGFTAPVESYEVSLVSGALIQSTSPTADVPRAVAALPEGPSRRTADLTVLDHDTDVADVRSLTKAVAVGERLAADAAGLEDALAGGAPTAALFGGERFVKPASGTFTSGFGARWGTSHYGIDIANRIGTPIYAVTDGTVIESGPASGFGLWVRVRHPGGWTSVYGHINRSLVHEGQKVKAGQQIAEMGNRGQSTGPHLHLEIWDPNGRKINPLPWLATRGIRVTGYGADPR